MQYLSTFGDGNKGGGTKGGANPKPPTGRNPRPPSGGRVPPLSASLRKLDAIAAKRKSGVKKGPPTRAKATTSTRGGPVTKAMMAASRRNAARRDLRARSRKIFGDLV